MKPFIEPDPIADYELQFIQPPHSPLPWFTHPELPYVGYDRIDRDSEDDDAEIVTVANLEATAENLDGGMDEAMANAAFIVRSCNAHDALLTALDFLSANPNNPVAHRRAFDAMKLARKE